MKRKNPLKRPPFIVCVLLGCILMAMTRCSPKTTETELPVEAPEDFSQSGNEEMPDEWWTAFENPSLNEMVDSALSSNFGIKSTWQQLRAAQAVVDRESSSLLPDVDASSQGGIQRPVPDYVGGENVQLGLNAVYEVDFWGRIRSRVEAERFRADATFLDYRTAAISLSAEIVRTWYRYVAAQRQVEVLEGQIETNERTLSLLNSRFGGGQIRSVDILRQRQLLESTRAQKIDAETQVDVLENQLTVLLGNPPQQTFDYTPNQLPELPPLPQTGVPTDLVQRRPDVMSAFYRVQAADREVASAISDQYPRLTISATSAMRSNTVDNLFQNWAQSFTGNLVAPLFYGGRLSAEVDRTKAVKKQRIYEYGQTVLTAFQEVENALVQETQQKERIDKLESQLELADQTYEQLRIQYFNGMSNYLDVLDQLNQLQQLRRDLITAKLNLVEYRISLYRALAGGFETERETNE